MSDLLDLRGQPVILLADYIKSLQLLEHQYGGAVMVQKWMPARGRHNAPVPAVGYALTDKGGYQQFWHSSDPPHKQGELIVRI